MDIKNRLLSVLITIAIILGGMLLAWLIVTYDIIMVAFIVFIIALCIGVVSDMIYCEIKRKR